MSNLIRNDLEKCTGCNRCIRVCPVDEANVAYLEDGATKVRVDGSKCIACGACLHVCAHGSRSYGDDTELFFSDLRKKTPISLFCAPAGRANLKDWGRVLSLLQKMGVQKMYDVSLGADICTWAYIRYIQKYNKASLISQPCPAIVNYILMHRNELLPYLSPVQSPMMCVAIYMKKYHKITDRIAALSPCIAKTNEFEATGKIVSYNITFKKLEDYINNNKLDLPTRGRGYDHIESSIGSLYSMPGGLKENVEFMIGKELRVDRSEGTGVVYRALDAFSKEDESNLPAIFDVLNCAEGCNLGTGCHHKKTIFEVHKAMDGARRNSTQGRDREYFEQLYQEYDKTLRLEDFIRSYRATPVKSIKISSEAIEEAFIDLGKLTESDRVFNCSACGSDTCEEMAIKIAKKINFSDNCIVKDRNAMRVKDANLMRWHENNARVMKIITADIGAIKSKVDQTIATLSNVNEVIGLYETLIDNIDRIAANIHMISLNASIEAARVGEHGRTFAVVAESIRSLAGETQETTYKIEKATKEAQTALGGISEMVLAISGDVSKSQSNISEIVANTTAMEDSLK
jgi:iron only hydrogenase large subunit-like protein